MNSEYNGRKVKLLVTIITKDEKDLITIAETCNESTNAFNVSFMGRGTAKKTLLKYLGIAEVEKEIMLSLISDSAEKEVLKAINRNLKLYLPGNGIAFTISLSSISGILNNAITMTLQKQSTKTKGETNMETGSKVKYDLIIACVNPTYIDEVIEATRIAGATGGTIINARGIDNNKLEDFLGTSIQTELEIILIITLKSAKNDIMKAIQNVAGFKTDGGAILFSLPVDNLIGIGRVDNELVD